MDIFQEVIGGWRGERGMVAAMTLVWGVTLERRGRLRQRRARPGDRRCRSSTAASRCSPPTPTTTSISDIVLKDGVGVELVRESLYEDDE